MKPLKILHVINKLDPQSGGVSQAVRTMVRGLNETHTVNEVASLDSPESDYLKGQSFPVHALGPGKGPWCYNSDLASWLKNNLSKHDIVILHGLWLYVGYALLHGIRNLQKQGEVPIPQLYVMPHGMLDPYFQRAPERKLKALRNQFYWGLIERKIVNEATGLLFTCNEERRLAQHSFRPYLPKQEHVVGLGVEEPPAFVMEMQRVFLESCPQLLGLPYFLFISRLDEKKGVDLLLQAYSDLLRSVITTPGEDSRPPKLIIAGPGLDTPYGISLSQMVAGSEELRENVVFTGMLTGAAKWGAFYGCEAFVLPSHQENFGIAVVEALACAKPVLISNQINIWQEIETGGAGFVAKDSVEGTKDLLDAWISLTPEKKKGMGRKARLVYEKQYALKPASNALYNTLMHDSLTQRLSEKQTKPNRDERVPQSSAKMQS